MSACTEPPTVCMVTEATGRSENSPRSRAIARDRIVCEAPVSRINRAGRVSLIWMVTTKSEPCRSSGTEILAGRAAWSFGGDAIGG